MATADEILAEAHDTSVAVIDDPDTALPSAPPEPAPKARDERGKFAKAEKPEPEPDIATPEPSAVEGGVAEEPAAPVESPPLPWQFRGSGMDIAPKGALHKPGVGVFFPDTPETMDYLRQRLTHGEKYAATVQRADRAEQMVKAGATRHSLENQAFVEAFGALLDEAQGPALIQQWAQNPTLAVRELKLALRQKHMDIQAAHSGPVFDATQDSDDGRAVKQFYEQLDDSFERSVSSIWPDISPDEKVALETLVAGSYQSFMTRATADDPHGRWVRGQVIPAQHVLDTVIRGKRAETRTAPTPPAARPTPAKVAPPAIGGPARNLAGAQAGKPQPSSGITSAKAAHEFWK